MKWYTLEERLIKKHDMGLICLNGYEFVIAFCDQYKEKKWIVCEPNQSIHCQIEDIKFWIPIEELKLTLPRDKE